MKSGLYWAKYTEEDRWELVIVSAHPGPIKSQVFVMGSEYSEDIDKFCILVEASLINPDGQVYTG